MIIIEVVLLVCLRTEPDACYDHTITHSVEKQELTPWKCAHYGMQDAIGYLKKKGFPKDLMVAAVTCGKYKERA